MIDSYAHHTQSYLATNTTKHPSERIPVKSGGFRIVELELYFFVLPHLILGVNHSVNDEGCRTPQIWGQRDQICTTQGPRVNYVGES